MAAIFTPVPGLSDAQRKAIDDQLALPLARPRKAPRRSLAVARAAMERAGERILTAEVEPPGRTAKVRVRVFFTSEGGEIVAMDSGPLTSRAADDLEHACLRSDSDAIGVARYKLDGTPIGLPRGFAHLGEMTRWGRAAPKAPALVAAVHATRVLPDLASAGPLPWVPETQDQLTCTHDDATPNDDHCPMCGRQIGARKAA